MIHLPYEGTELKQHLSVGKIFSVHYFEYARDFVFEGEKHDFWEFICVDRGEVQVASGEDRLLLSKDRIAFHEPGEFHDVRAAKHTAPNLMVVSFSCDSEAMSYFRKKVFTMDEEEKELLGKILREARNVFENRLNDPYSYRLVRMKDCDPESEQLLTSYLLIFLLHLMQRTRKTDASAGKPAVSKRITYENDTDGKYLRILHFFENHMDEMLSVDEICRHNMISRSQLFSIFQKKESCGPMESFNRLKTEKAKVMIRQTDLQFSQIAIRLGYSSLFYFSRSFKKYTGMSPSEYSKSIKALSERSR